MTSSSLLGEVIGTTVDVTRGFRKKPDSNMETGGIWGNN